MIDPETAQKIKDAADIVEVVGDYVRLTRRGANYMGLCPFHNERTPSFSVNKAKNYCYCFSCKKGGSPVNFLIEKEGISYQDALRMLANKYGIRIEERELSEEDKQNRSEREAMFITNAWAMEKMESDLINTAEGKNVGLSYFNERGITEEARKAFRLGYAIDSFSHLSEAAVKEGYDPDVLTALGLIGHTRDGKKYYDRFRGRVIFPILNPAGKVVAFGGRDLKGNAAKYINSPESRIYKKSNELYGFYQAKSAILKSDNCFLVEGYMDVIGMWQSGLQNTVASSGTALTPGQASLIHRFTENVTLIYDGDQPGIKAALKGMDVLLAQNLNVKLLLLPDGHDPDSFSRTRSPEEFRKFVEENSTDIVRFKAQVLMKDSGNDPLRKAAAVKSIVTSLAAINDGIKRAVYLRECSRMLDIDESVLSLELSKQRHLIKADLIKEREKARYPDNPPHPQTPEPATAVDAPQPQHTEAVVASSAISSKISRCEAEVLRYCVKYGMVELFSLTDDSGAVMVQNVIEYIKEELDADGVAFSTPLYAKIFNMLLDMLDDYFAACERELQEADSDEKAALEAGIAEIAEKASNMADIEKREQQLRDSLAAEKTRRMNAFAEDFARRRLADCEDSDVRKTATEMVADPHVLSKFHSKYAVIYTELERLPDLVPRAISEWKEQIIADSINEIQQRISEAAEDDNFEELTKLIAEKKRLISIRSELSRNNGDRIISPK